MQHGERLGRGGIDSNRLRWSPPSTIQQSNCSGDLGLWISQGLDQGVERSRRVYAGEVLDVDLDPRSP